MKISVNDQELYTLTETQKKVIMNDIHADIFKDDMKRRLHYIVMDRIYKKSMEKMRKDWDQQLRANGVKSFPVDNDAYADLVLKQPQYRDYKSRQQKE